MGDMEYIYTEYNILKETDGTKAVRTGPPWEMKKYT